MKMPGQIGSIAEGKLADLVGFDANSPSMVCAGIHDPVAAIVLHSSLADVDAVIVDGVVRKQNGKLLELQLDNGGQKVAGTRSLKWADIATNSTKTRRRIQAEAEKIDYKDDEKKVMEAFGNQESDLADP